MPNYYESTFSKWVGSGATDALKHILEFGFPTSSVNHLHLTNGIGWSIDVFDAFGSMNLRSIVASHTESASAVVAALRTGMLIEADYRSPAEDVWHLSGSASTDEELGGDYHPIIFPQLESLTFTNVDFGLTRFKLEDLISILSHRKARGHRGLLRLQVRDSNNAGWCHDPAFGALKEVVDEVLWDGKSVPIPKTEFDGEPLAVHHTQSPSPSSALATINFDYRYRSWAPGRRSHSLSISTYTEFVDSGSSSG